MSDDLPSALELAGHAFRLVNEEHHDVKDGLLEVNDLQGAEKLPPQRNHLVEKQLEALHLNFRAREAIKQRAVLLLGLKQLTKEDADYLPVSHHSATRLDRARLRCLKELGNHDGRRADAAHLADEVRIGAFACARSPPEQDQLPGKTHPAPADFPLELPPDGTKDDLRILDLQVGGVCCSRREAGRSLLALPRANTVILHPGAFYAPNQMVPILICK